MCEKAKENWIEGQCKDIEELKRMHGHGKMHQSIKSITNLKKNCEVDEELRVLIKMKRRCMKLTI